MPPPLLLLLLILESEKLQGFLHLLLSQHVNLSHLALHHIMTFLTRVADTARRETQDIVHTATLLLPVLFLRLTHPTISTDAVTSSTATRFQGNA